MAFFIPLEKYDKKQITYIISYTTNNHRLSRWLFTFSTLLHPIKNLIRDFKADLCLLLGRQGVACVLQCSEACVWQGFECFFRGSEWYDIVVFAVINMHRDS